MNHLLLCFFSFPIAFYESLISFFCSSSRCTVTSKRHSGHTALFLIHFSMHSAWKMWALQGNATTLLWCSKVSRQIAQVNSSSSMEDEVREVFKPVSSTISSKDSSRSVWERRPLCLWLKSLYLRFSSRVNLFNFLIIFYSVNKIVLLLQNFRSPPWQLEPISHTSENCI